MNYKLGSLFDGSGGFPLAGALCDIEPVWAAEVEPYPIAVTRSRFPTMKHLGDISKINGANIEPVDIITFGSPCQDLSVAGKRAGLKHASNGDEETTRSGLFMEAVRIIKEMRKATNGQYPTFALWENVPGAFSSNKGEDFKVVCEELIKIVEPSATMPSVPQKGWNYSDSYVGDGWSLAYRVLDAQYWGVPQRRRRIYLVADFRGERAREVLFEREGLRGYFTQGRTPWQAAPADAQGSTGADDRERESKGRGRQLDDVGIPYTLKIRSGCEVDSAGKGAGKGALIQENLSATLATSNDQYLFQPIDPTFIIDNIGGQAEYGKVTHVNGTLRSGAQGAIGYVVEKPPIICMATQQGGAEIRTDDKAPTITAAAGMSGNNQPVICLQGNGIDRADTAGCNGAGWREDKSYTLNTIDRPAVAYGVTTKGNGDAFISKERHTALSGGGGQAGQGYPCVAYGLDRASFNQGQNAKFDFTVAEESQPTLTARGPGAVCTIGLSGGQVSPTLISRMSSAVGTTQDHLIVTEKHEGEPPAMCCTTGSFTQATEEVAPTLMARDWKDPTVVMTNYIVRRLTPTECARLQGFADRWGAVDKKKKFTDEEYRFWLDVRNTHASINGKKVQEYTAKQMLTWYNKLWTDSAEYKMWGNGIALPTALYALQGIADALQSQDPVEDWML